MKNSLIKRFIVLICTVLLFFPVILRAVGANAPVTFGLFSDGYDSKDSDASDLFSIVDRRRLHDQLLAGFKNCSATVDISEFNIAFTNETLTALRVFVWDEVPEAFHVSTLSAKISGSKIQALNATYTMDKASYSAEFSKCEKAAEKILSGLSSLSDPVVKALLVHDRLIVKCEYDYDRYLSDSLPLDSFRMNGCLNQERAVCDGFARAYNYLLSKLGIPCRKTNSSSNNHSWNIVTIAGKDYHVDITADDRAYDVYGRVYHECFLRSTNGIKKTINHAGSDFDTSPSDTTYDSAYWKKAISEIQYIDGKLYFIDGISGKLMRYSGGSLSSLLTVNGSWGGYYIPSYDGGMRFTCFSSLIYRENRLIYNTESAIKSCNLYGSNVKSELKPTLGSRRIIGFKANNNRLYIDTAAYDEVCGTPEGRKNHLIIMDHSFSTQEPDVPDTPDTPDTPIIPVIPETKDPYIKIVKTGSTSSFLYKSTIVFTAEAGNINVPYEIRWYINGAHVANGQIFTVENAQSSFSIECKAVNVNNKPIASSDKAEVNINDGFFARIIAFFSGLFGERIYKW